MVHRKQDELGLVKDEVKDGATGSPSLLEVVTAMLISPVLVQANV
jgi:hypothetical protein